MEGIHEWMIMMNEAGDEIESEEIDTQQLASPH